MSQATFAAGCFWGVEKVFKKNFPAATSKVGYIGGVIPKPSYQAVCSGLTGHSEAIQISFDPSIYSYESLVDFFYRMHDPTTKNRQGNDTGTQYRSAIFYHDDEQLKIATEITEKIKPYFGRYDVSTTLEKAGVFYEAEGYHQ
ncbi:Peptide-methionine (S)-S-oxide reductase, partial [Nowakowskiella sp. JEL0078]